MIDVLLSILFLVFVLGAFLSVVTEEIGFVVAGSILFFVGFFCLIAISAKEEAKEKEAFMSSCTKEQPEYICYASWKGFKS